MESKSVISIALNKGVKEVKNEEPSRFFVTKKDEAYITNNLPMLMKCMEKKCQSFLNIIVEKNGKKPLTANQISKVVSALLNDRTVLEVVKKL